MKKKLKRIASILAIGLFLFLAFGSGSDGEDSTIDLNATIRFTGTQFVITNNDNFDYKKAELEVNNKYILKGNTLKAGETYNVGIMQFADGDGNRMNTMIKPQKFTIWCDVKDGKTGFLYAEMN